MKPDFLTLSEDEGEEALDCFLEAVAAGRAVAGPVFTAAEGVTVGDCAWATP